MLSDIKCISRCQTDKVQTLVPPKILRHAQEHRGGFRGGLLGDPQTS